MITRPTGRQLEAVCLVLPGQYSGYHPADTPDFPQKKNVSLHTILSPTDKATHPTNRQEDWEYIIGFCDQINKELEGYVQTKHFTPHKTSGASEQICHLLLFLMSRSPQIAVKLLVHKIHSPQEWEALQALTVSH